MIKCIYIDGYKTIEKSLDIVWDNNSYFDRISALIDCASSDIKEHADYFSKEFGNSIWIYHEIFWRSFINRYCTHPNEQLLELVYDIFLDYYEEKVDLYPGTYATLQVLSKYVKLILVANGNSKRLKRLIKKFNFNDIFTDYVISSETPYQKPNKFMFEYCLQMYGFFPEEVLMVGDKYGNDILGAKKCGLLTAIMISNSSAPTNYIFTPDFMLSNISELKNLMKLNSSNKLKLIKSTKERTSCFQTTSAFIVAGGKGSRLGKLGLTTQKCMLLLWGKPLIYYVILSLKNVGCAKIVIAVNHLKEQIINYFGDGSQFGISIEYVTGNFIGTYDALYQSLNKLNNQIIYVHANILFQNMLLENIMSLAEDTKTNVVSIIKDSHHTIRHAQMDIDNRNYILKLDISERNGKLDYTYLGVACYYKDSILRYYDGDNSGMVEKIISQQLQHGENVKAYLYEGGWRHIETSKDYYDISKQNRWEIYCEEH
jgi:haloacid dehalogenase superfamily, subfamily IA, variant 1 with third motif having Dx(3-4)D or Dx(3-4)E